MPKVKKIVVLGGGNAMPRTVLTGLKKYPVRLSVISAVLDSGGSAGRLRVLTGISFGDIRRAALTLSKADQKTKNYFARRDGQGHVAANIFCAAIVAKTGSVEKAIDELKRRLKFPARHQILPATLDNADICAVLENGKIIVGETNIDIPKHNGKLKIKKVYLKPKARVYPKSLEAIKKADLIIIGPGDLYSSLSQILLVEGMAQAIRKSKAKKVYICNLMTKYGETNNFQVADFVAEIDKLLGQPLDYVIYNTQKPSQAKLTSYRKKHPELLKMVENKITDKRFIGQKLITDSFVYQPDKLAKIILSLCKP